MVCELAFLLKHKSSLYFLFNSKITNLGYITRLKVTMLEIVSTKSSPNTIKMRSYFISFHELKHDSRKGTRHEKWASLKPNTCIVFPKKHANIILREAILAATHYVNRLLNSFLGLKSPMEAVSSFYPKPSTTNNLIPCIFFLCLLGSCPKS